MEGQAMVGAAVVDAQRFTKQLTWAKKLIGRQVVPVVECAKLEWRGDQLGIEVTDLDAWARFNAPALEHDGDGSVAIKVRSMLDGLGKPKRGDTATLRAWGGDGDISPYSELFAGNVAAKPPTYPLEDFPTPPQIDRTWQLAIRGEHFEELLRSVIDCSSKEGSRFQLSAVAVTQRGDGLRFVATDGHRLAIAEAPGYGEAFESGPPQLPVGSGPGRKLRIVLMRLHAAAMALSWPERGKGDVKLSGNTSGDLAIDLPGCCVFAREVGGTFPDYERIEDQIKPVVTMKLRAAELADLCTAAKRLSGSGRSGSGLSVVITTGDGGCPSTAEYAADGTTAKNVIAGTTDWKEPSETGPIKVGLNPAYVLDALKAAGEDEITLGIVSGDRAVRLSWTSASTGIEVQHLIMPVRI